MILVTGGTGFVGSRVVTALATAGRAVRVVSRRPPPAALPEGVESCIADLLDVRGRDNAFRNVTTVIHLAARLEGSGMADVNVEAARLVADGSRRAGVMRFIHCSSGGVYGDGTSLQPHRESDVPRPATPYERTKLEGEQAVISTLADAVPWVVLRPTGVYGPGRAATRDFLNRVAHQRLWLHGPARVIVHPSYVDDVVSAIVATTEREECIGHVINVGGERALDYPELIALAARLMGRRARQFAVPRLVAEAGAALRQRDLMPDRFSRLARPIINRAVDTTEAARRLGLKPVPLDEGLRRTIAEIHGETAR